MPSSIGRSLKIPRETDLLSQWKKVFPRGKKFPKFKADSSVITNPASSPHLLHKIIYLDHFLFRCVQRALYFSEVICKK